MIEDKKFTAEDARAASMKNEMTYERVLTEIETVANGAYCNRQCHIMGFMSSEVLRKLLADGYNISTIKDQLSMDITIIKW